MLGVLQKYDVGELVNNKYPVFPKTGYVRYHGHLRITFSCVQGVLPYNERTCSKVLQGK